jgi:Cu-Zn family superoxide dismutase
VKGQAKLGVYSLTTGERIAMVDLGPLAGAGDAGYFANDVAVTNDGTIYVTDTMRNVIYRVDGDYSATLFHRFEPMEGLGLNGIVAHDDGYLIVVANGGSGTLYRVPLANPGGSAAITLDQPATGADGLDWAADGRLASISNSTGSVTLYGSTDGWMSARATATASFDGQATTGTAVDEQIYVVQPHFNDAEQPVILRADF